MPPLAANAVTHRVPIFFVLVCASFVRVSREEVPQRAAVGGQQPRAVTAAAGVVRHRLQVTLDPATSRLLVNDRVTLPPSGASLPDFVLNARLRIVSATPAVEEVSFGAARALWDAPGSPPTVKRYRLRTAPAGRVFTVQYEGAVNFPLSPEKEEYTRGFRQTRGSVSKDGVYLAGETAWYPQFGTRLVEFTMDARAAAPGWHLISQGSGTSRDPDGVARWNSPQPMDEIYLVGGPLVVSSLTERGVNVLVYLRKPDSELANRYLATGAQYIRMYAALIGPYPYDKFALIENFWETGYGMPSFTLLGPQVIRFPFILHSSYPHEILHNWWGNSVFVDYATGNWCEGLTAYLADHLIAEQRGGGAEHRRDVLQRYRDYVREARDFPLANFRSRDSASTEAIGYGKALMLFHQLRRTIGDQRFVALLRRLYGDYRGQRASWKDVQREAEAAAGRGLAPFFDQWLSRAGAPSLQVRDVAVRQAETSHVVSGVLVQTQAGQPYRISVPVVVQTVAGFVRAEVRMEGATAAFEITSLQAPVALNVDPYFDVFRTLSTSETPPAVSQMFGESRVLALLPSRAAPEQLRAYRSLLASWRSDTHAIDVRLDSEVTALPADRAVWLLGSDNLLAPELFRRYRGMAAGAVRGGAGRAFGGQTSAPKAASGAGATWVLIGRHPANLEKAIGWIFTDDPRALAALARKLPHYGKYSYLYFEGPDAVSRRQGQSNDAVSPLRVDLRTPSDRRGELPPVPPDPAKALAQLPGAR